MERRSTLSHFPQDLTYAICIDEEKNRVLVVFRGAITKQDWTKALGFSQKKARNPIQEDFEDKPENVDMHYGFYKYLFRVRKDTGTTKYEEICNVAHKYGMERLGEGYELAVTGHSLGAALTTVYGFWASTDSRFTKNGPVKLFSFGSPMVGGQLFADSFRHQERTGKLMYVRFYNHNDAVAYMPFNFGFSKVRTFATELCLFFSFCFSTASLERIVFPTRGHWRPNPPFSSALVVSPIVETPSLLR
jgi:predicted lipase